MATRKPRRPRGQPAPVAPRAGPPNQSQYAVRPFRLRHGLQLWRLAELLGMRNPHTSGVVMLSRWEDPGAQPPFLARALRDLEANDLPPIAQESDRPRRPGRPPRPLGGGASLEGAMAGAVEELAAFFENLPALLPCPVPGMERMRAELDRLAAFRATIEEAAASLPEALDEPGPAV